MKKSFLAVLGVVGVVSAVAGASPAMANYKATKDLAYAAGATDSGPIVTSSGTNGTYKLKFNSTSQAELDIMIAFAAQQSLVAVDCTLGAASDYSVGTANVVNCPAGTIHSAQGFINLN